MEDALKTYDIVFQDGRTPAKQIQADEVIVEEGSGYTQFKREGRMVARLAGIGFSEV